MVILNLYYKLDFSCVADASKKPLINLWESINTFSTISSKKLLGIFTDEYSGYTWARFQSAHNEEHLISLQIFMHFSNASRCADRNLVQVVVARSIPVSLLRNSTKQREDSSGVQPSIHVTCLVMMTWSAERDSFLRFARCKKKS